MTKQEFTELTGINPTEEEFDKIYELYMATGAKMDKQSFCAAYKNCKDMTLVNAIYHSLAFSINRLKKERDSIEKEAVKELEDLREKTNAAAVKILDVAERTTNPDHADFLNKAAVSLVGQFDVCRTKLEKGYAMDEEERNFLIDEIYRLKWVI